MLIKSIDTKEADLVEKAKELILERSAQPSGHFYVPYIDECTDEIRYLSFILQSNKWVLENGIGYQDNQS